MDAQTPAELYVAARHGLDEDYLAAERRLLAAGPAARELLDRKRVEDPDPVARLMAELLADELAGKPTERQAVLSTLDATEQGLRGTPMSAPSGEYAAHILTRHHQARATRVLALYLVKRPSWTPWRLKAALGYLRHHLDPHTLPALLRYVVVTPPGHLPDHALDTARQLVTEPVEPMLDELRRVHREGKRLGAP